MMTYHRQSPCPNFFVFSTARSGSTWLLEMIATQGRYKLVNEPFNLRKPWVRENLGLDTWESLFQVENKPVIQDYIESFIEGRDVDCRFKREWPFTKFWHLRTDRVIFKILFAGEDDFDWFRLRFGGNVIFLLRHPIPVSLSRQEFPRLGSFLSPPYAEHFSEEQLRHADSVIRSGDKFRIAVLDWCLQNAVPLGRSNPHWLVVSYEQIVMQPEVVIDHLTKTFDLPRPDRMLEQVYIASRSTGMSSQESQTVLLSDVELRKKRSWLIERWREKITPEMEHQAFYTISLFGIEYYELGRALPGERHMLPELEPCNEVTGELRRA